MRCSWPTRGYTLLPLQLVAMRPRPSKRAKRRTKKSAVHRDAVLLYCMQYTYMRAQESAFERLVGYARPWWDRTCMHACTLATAGPAHAGTYSAAPSDGRLGHAGARAGRTCEATVRAPHPPSRPSRGASSSGGCITRGAADASITPRARARTSR